MGAGKDLLLKVELVAGSGSYTTLGGLQAKTMTLNNEEIEITNHGSNQWKELLDGAGVRSMQVSGNGYYDDSAAVRKVFDNCQAGTLTNFQIIDTTSGGRTYQGSFKIVSFEYSSEHNGAQQYSTSLTLSGALTVS